MEALGRQIVMELVGCPADRLNDVVRAQEWMEAAARAAGATIINSTFHHFAPVGVSGVVVIQESHLALHTWPEYGFAALDIFTCGESVDPWKACHYLKVALEAKESTTQELARGQREDWQPQEASAVPTQLPAATREAWFTERREHLALSLRHQGSRLFATQSAHQRIEVYETSGYGPALVLDGAIAMTQADSPAYHEMLVHVPLQGRTELPHRVLILGGGDGAAVHEVLRYEEVDAITVVEHDPQIREASRVAFPKLARALDDPRVRWVHEEGEAFVASLEAEAYDLILVDTSEAYPDRFWQQLARALAPGGYAGVQAGSPLLHAEAIRRLQHQLKTHFPQHAANLYLVHLPTFPSGLWSYFQLGTPHYSPEPKGHLVTGQFHYYNWELHEAAFALPTFVHQILAE